MTPRIITPATGFAYRPGDSANPRLWRDLVDTYAPCIIGAGRTPPDLSPSRFDWSVNGTAYSVVGSPIGNAIAFAGNASHQQTAGTLPCKFCTNSIGDEFTIHAVFKYTHSAGAKESTIFWSDNQAANLIKYGYRLYVDNNTDKLWLMVANGDNPLTPATPTLYPSNTTLTTNKWYNAILTWSGYGRDGAGYDYCTMYLDGKDERYLATVFSAPSGVEEYCSHLSTLNSRVGSTQASIAPDVAVALVNVWKRCLTFHEVQKLSVDPLAMFQLRGAGGAMFPRITTWWNDRRRRVA